MSKTVEIDEADVTTVVHTAVSIAEEMMSCGDYPSAISYGSELPLEDLPVVLTAEQRDQHQVSCRLSLPEGEVFGRVSIYYGSSEAGRY